MLDRLFAAACKFVNRLLDLLFNRPLQIDLLAAVLLAQ